MSSKIDDEKIKTYNKWKQLVNMSASDLKLFLDTDAGKKAGLSRDEASSSGISRGRDSGFAILRMKSKTKDSWNTSDWNWAKKQISFISRMKGARGSLLDEKGKPTRKLLSLWVWGHVPNGIRPKASLLKEDASVKQTFKQFLNRN